MKPLVAATESPDVARRHECEIPDGYRAPQQVDGSPPKRWLVQLWPDDSEIAEEFMFSNSSSSLSYIAVRCT